MTKRLRRDIKFSVNQFKRKIKFTWKNFQRLGILSWNGVILYERRNSR